MSYLTRPATQHAAIVINTAFDECRAVYVGVGGDANITVNGVDVVYKNLANGQVLQVHATNVKTTSTTATDLIALY